MAWFLCGCQAAPTYKTTHPQPPPPPDPHTQSYIHLFLPSGLPLPVRCQAGNKPGKFTVRPTLPLPIKSPKTNVPQNLQNGPVCLCPLKSEALCLADICRVGHNVSPHGTALRHTTKSLKDAHSTNSFSICSERVVGAFPSTMGKMRGAYFIPQPLENVTPFIYLIPHTPSWPIIQSLASCRIQLSNMSLSSG